MISHHWSAQMRQVDSHLMRSSCKQPAADQRPVLTQVRLQNLKIRMCRLPFCRYGSFPMGATTQKGPNLPPVPFWNPGSHCQVLAKYSVPPKLFSQRLTRQRSLRKNQKTGSVLIQPMKQIQMSTRCFSGLPIFADQLDDTFSSLSFYRICKNAGGLFDNNDVHVFIDHFDALVESTRFQ